MTCAQGLLRLLWGGAQSWSATGLPALQARQSLVMWQDVGGKGAAMTVLNGTVKSPGLDKLIDE